MVTIPEVEKLSASQRDEVYNKAQYRLKWFNMTQESKANVAA